MFDEYGVTNGIVKENSQICNVNQDLRFNDHVTLTCNDVEKAQRTIKVLDINLDNSFHNGMIENMSSLSETMWSNLVKMKIPVELLVGSVINVTTKIITNSTVPAAIIAATKDKKNEIEKIMHASAKKVVFKWPSSLYMHIKLIRAGYEKSPTFANKQILIRPAANNRSLTTSTKNNSIEKWTFVEHLSYHFNPTDIQNLGQKTQPCKSNHKDIVFTFTSKKKLYKKIDKNKIKTLQNNFRTASGPKQPTSLQAASLELSNRFTALAATSTLEAAIVLSSVQNIKTQGKLKYFKILYLVTKNA